MTTEKTIINCAVCGRALPRGLAYASRNLRNTDGDRFCLCIKCRLAETKDEPEEDKE